MSFRQYGGPGSLNCRRRGEGSSGQAPGAPILVTGHQVRFELFDIGNAEESVPGDVPRAKRYHEARHLGSIREVASPICRVATRTAIRWRDCRAGVVLPLGYIQAGEIGVEDSRNGG